MSTNTELARRCALQWYELTPEMAREWFAEGAVYENRCDQGSRAAHQSAHAR